MKNKRSILIVVTSMIFVSGASYFHRTDNNNPQAYARSPQPSQYKMKPLANESASNTDGADIMSSSSSSSSSASSVPERSKTTESETPKITSSATVDSGLPDAGNWTANLPINQNGILGIAANFNIFANHITTSSSIIGSFATQNLVYNGGGGVSVGDSVKQSYIQSGFKESTNANIINNGGTTKQIVLGSQFSYDRNLMKLTNGTDNLTIKGDGLFRESHPQLDFDNEFTRLKNNSKQIAQIAQNNNPIVTNAGSWNQNFDLKNLKPVSGILYINFKSITDLENFFHSTPTNMSTDTKTVVANVNASTDINIEFWSANASLSDKKVMFNFYDTDHNKQFDKKIIASQIGYNLGMLFAPAATINVSNYNGNIVADKVNYATWNSLNNFPDINVPTGDDNSSQETLVVPKTIDFGKVPINSINTLTKEWTPNEQTGMIINGPADSTMHIGVAVSDQKINGVALTPQQNLTWNLIYTDPTAPGNNKTMPISQTSGIIDYWRWRGNSEHAWYPFKDWSWNKAHQNNGYYEFQLANLKNIQQIGQYTADMTWTIKDAP